MAFVTSYARGSRPRAGYAVVPSDFMKLLLPRKQQINQTEALAVALAPFNLKQRLQDLDLIHFVDNMGALAAMIRGYSPQEDAAAIACVVHLLHAKSSIRSFYEHVESEANVVDGFSREGEADKLAKGWDTFRAEVPLAASRSELSLHALTELFGIV